MPDRVSSHVRGAARIVGDGRKALADYVTRCKAMTPEQFAMEPRKLTSRLSAAQYLEIVRAIAPDALISKPAVADVAIRRDKP